jgi:hypothetical protein
MLLPIVFLLQILLFDEYELYIIFLPQTIHGTPLDRLIILAERTIEFPTTERLLEVEQHKHALTSADDYAEHCRNYVEQALNNDI